VEELDRRVVVVGMKLARRLLQSAPLAPYYAYEDFPGPNVQSDDEFLAAATERGTTTFHPGCTCRMGPVDAKWAVVDDQLRVHGLQGLRVVDASVMPRMISANLDADDRRQGIGYDSGEGGDGSREVSGNGLTIIASQRVARMRARW
jgi:choline dehydrogenase